MTESNQPSAPDGPRPDAIADGAGDDAVADDAQGAPAQISATGSFEDQERAVGIDPDAPLPGEQGMRIILFGGIAVLGIPSLLAAGIAAGYPIVGVVLAVALGAVCLLVARPRRSA